MFGQLVVMEIFRPRAYTKDKYIVFQESDKMLKGIVKTCRAFGQAQSPACHDFHLRAKAQARAKAQVVKRHERVVYKQRFTVSQR